MGARSLNRCIVGRTRRPHAQDAVRRTLSDTSDTVRCNGHVLSLRE